MKITKKAVKAIMQAYCTNAEGVASSPPSIVDNTELLSLTNTLSQLMIQRERNALLANCGEELPVPLPMRESE